MKIGRVLTELRNKKHLTQDQMADTLGVKRPRYNAWENDISNPDFEMVKRIAEFHKVSVDYLLGLTDISSRSEEEIDDDIRAIQRAAKNMSPKDRKKMIDMIKLTFDDAFNEDDEDDEDDI